MTTSERKDTTVKRHQFPEHARLSDAKLLAIKQALMRVPRQPENQAIIDWVKEREML